MSIQERVLAAYSALYQEKPRLFRSPGRINLIGEHTDYNNGFVLPAGVDKAVYFAISPRTDTKVILHAVDLNDSYTFELGDLSKPEKEWPAFQLAVLDQFQKQNLKISGFQAVFGGDIPLGAGMSSSAALECCLIYGLNEIFSLGLNRLEIVKMGQKAENEYVGVNCGIMDQFASVFGKEGAVVRLDCQSLEYHYFPFHLKGYSLILCDTTVKHSLASSEYNTRRAECEEGVRILQKYYPSIQSLRDATREQVEAHKAEMSENVYRRCAFMTEEISRVIKACQLLEEDDATGFGALMYETHEGLSKWYEVSCEELDFLVDITHTNEAVAGARMMGGGFGGCTLNLVQSDYLEQFEKEMKEAYLSQFGRELPCYKVVIADGTSEVLL